MDYILGAGLLFAAVVTIALGRLALGRAAAPGDAEAFGAAEAIAFVFTVILSLGVALMARKAFEEASLLSLAEMAGALLATVVLSVAAWKGLARLAARARGEVDALAGPTAPGRGRPHRPTGTGARGGRRTQAKRVA